MDRFLRCLCLQDYSALIISGSPSEQELQEAWVVILGEYHTLSSDTTEVMEHWLLERDIFRLRNHLVLLQYCIDLLNEKYSDSVADSINKLGYSFRPVEKEPAKYRNLLTAITGRAKTKYIHLQQLIKQLDEKNKKVDPEKKPSWEYFESLLVEIEEMQGTAYSFETLKVTKWTQLEKKYWRKVELHNEAVAAQTK